MRDSRPPRSAQAWESELPSPAGRCDWVAASRPQGPGCSSATKKVDVAVFDTIKAAQDGTFKGGGNQTFDLTNNATGIGKISAAGQPYAAKVAAVATKIKSGSITPPDTVK